MEYRMAQQQQLQQAVNDTVGTLTYLSSLLSQPGDLVLTDQEKRGMVSIYEGLIHKLKNR